MAESIPVTDYKDLSKIYTGRKQHRDPAKSKPKPVFALDTETRNGDIFLIADSEGNFEDKITLDSVIRFLFSKRYQQSWNFFYNLEYDAGSILKLLGSRLNIYKNTRILSFDYNQFKFTYISKKCLRITKGHHSVSFYDIMQFYDNQKLDVAYQNNIGELSSEYLEMKNKRKIFSTRYYNRNKNKVRDYCIQDCTNTKQLSKKWIDLFHDAFSFYPLKWFSSGYLAEKVLINNGIHFPKFDSIPYEIQDMALRSYVGGRFEMTKRGFIGESYIYDINSAYPFALTKIPDLSNGKWIRRKSIHDKSKLGFFRILADIPDDKYVSPFPFKAKSDLVFPTGKFETYVTLAELESCENDSWYEILDSYQFVPNSNYYPYKKFIESMYQKRLELKNQNNPLQLPLKIILNAIYGKTGQKVNRIMGNLFNPVIFASITGHNRAQLYQCMIDNKIERNIVAFATDSICTSKKLSLDSAKLGEFSFDNMADDTVFFQNGLYRMNGKWKQRGLGKTDGKEIDSFETFEKDDKLYIKYNVLKNSTLKSSIIHGKIDDIGRIKPSVKKINLNGDKKRLWLGRINSVTDKITNDSMPLSLNHMTKEQIHLSKF